MMGDWLTYVAVGLLALSGPQGLVGVALVQLAHSLPQAVAAPLAGWLTDRVDRRVLLVGASIARGLVTLAMAFAAWRGEVGWVEGLLFVRMAGAAFIMAPSRAALPQLVEVSELVPANRLLGASWAVFFTVGVAVGGVVSGWFGPTTALLIDALTFGVAAVIFSWLGPLAPSPRDKGVGASLLADARAYPHRVRVALAKVPMLFANGATWVILHALVGAGPGAAFGLGGLHAARGVGNGFGAWALTRLGERRMVSVGLGSVLAGGLVLSVEVDSAELQTGLWIVGCLLWGVGVGATWVGATLWLQKEIPDAILGRYTALDVGVGSVASAAGGLSAAACHAFLSPSLTLGIIAAVSLIAFAAVRTRAAVAVVVVLAVCAPVRAQTPLRDALAERAVTDASVIRRELYTWTSRAQAARLRRDRVLLVSGPADGAVRSPYQIALDAEARGDDASADLARALSEHPALARRRYAWPEPWGTALPRGSRSYGPVLVRMTIDRDALFVRFAPDEPEPFRVLDAAGHRQAISVALADPSRIGVVFHVRRDERLGPYREYIVHGHVSEWSMATSVVRDRIRADLRLLERLRAMRPDLGSNRRHWTTLGGSASAVFAATMPFDTLRHRPSPRTVRALIARLRGWRARGPPLRVEPAQRAARGVED